MNLFKRHTSYDENRSPSRSRDSERSLQSWQIPATALYSQRLFHYAYSEAIDEVERHFLVFAGLQRLNILHLQNELARMRGEMWRGKGADGDTMKKLDTTLQLWYSLLPSYLRCVFPSSCFLILTCHFVESNDDPRPRIPQATFRCIRLAERNQVDSTESNKYLSRIAALPGSPYEASYSRLPDSTLLASDPPRDWLKKYLHRPLTVHTL